MSGPMIGYLDPDFVKIMEEVSELLGRVFNTEDALTMVLSGTGSAGMEAGVSSLLVGIGDVERQDDPDSVSWRAVDGFEPPDLSTWTLWQHRFTPPRSGEYEITLRVGETDVRTRRLDSGYYARRVRL